MHTMRHFIDLIPLREAAVYDLYGYHGTSSKFLDSIRSRGLVRAPKERVFDTDLIAYTGAYFSDTLAVALWASTRATAKFGGQSIVVICGIDVGATAGDEDDIIEFIENLQGETPEEMAEEYYDYYGEAPPDIFFKLIRVKNLRSPRARKAIDAMSREMGPITKASGNSGAVTFRVPEGVPPDEIAAIIQCSFTGDFDPSYLPRDFQYQVVYGSVPPGAKLW